MALLDEQPYIGYPQMGRRRAMPNRDVEMNQGLLRGASYYPTDLLGSPIDLINMGLKPLGMGSQKPVMGSDYLQSLAQQYGLSQQPTGSNAENVARLAMSAMNPATGARAVGKVIEPTMQALAPKAGQMAEDYLRSIGGIADIVPAKPSGLLSGGQSEILKAIKPIQSGDTVDGRFVRSDIPNTSSISASLDDYSILPGVQEVPLNIFETKGKPSYYSVSEEKRTKNLADQIKESKEINPLIVVLDKEGAYILEGGHRFDALRELDAKSMPAMVVVDKNNPPMDIEGLLD